MKRNDSIMFSRDGKKFTKATFIENTNQLNAAKIWIGDEEWTVKQSEIYSTGDFMKIKAQNFLTENETLIDAWLEAQTKMEQDSELKISKASIARSLKIGTSKACHILNQWVKLHQPLLK